jgi:hypothetical protein
VDVSDAEEGVRQYQAADLAGVLARHGCVQSGIHFFDGGHCGAIVRLRPGKG